jgi:hypothetical protein
MPQGSKAAYTSKQKRQARHIERSARRRGKGPKTAARIGWATVNKQTGGGRKRSSRGSGRRPSRGRKAGSRSH